MGLDSIELIIMRWAPPKENSTGSYIRTVARMCGIDRKEQIRFDSREQMLALVQAMAYVENGVVISREGCMTRGYDMAVGIA